MRENGKYLVEFAEDGMVQVSEINQFYMQGHGEITRKKTGFA